MTLFRLFHNVDTNISTVSTSEHVNEQRESNERNAHQNNSQSRNSNRKPKKKSPKNAGRKVVVPDPINENEVIHQTSKWKDVLLIIYTLILLFSIGLISYLYLHYITIEEEDGIKYVKVNINIIFNGRAKFDEIKSEKGSIDDFRSDKSVTVNKINGKTLNFTKILVSNITGNSLNFNTTEMKDMRSETGSIDDFRSINSVIVNEINGKTLNFTKILVSNITGNSLNFRKAEMKKLRSKNGLIDDFSSDKIVKVNEISGKTSTFDEISVVSISGDRLNFNTTEMKDMRSETGSIDDFRSINSVTVNTINGKLSTFDEIINKGKYIADYMKFEDYTKTITADGKTIKHNYDENTDHYYYLNEELRSIGIYHLSFKYNGKYKLILGLQTSKSKNTKKRDDNEICILTLYGGYSSLNGLCGTKEAEKIEDIKAIDNSIYELIIDMNKRKTIIKQNNGKEIPLFTNIKQNIIPFVGLYYVNDMVSLIKSEYI